MGQAVETRVIEADEQGRLIIPAEMLADARPHNRFVVETTGSSILVQPEIPSPPESKPKLTPAEWIREWRELAEDVGKAWQSDKSGLEELTDMRNARG